MECSKLPQFNISSVPGVSEEFVGLGIHDFESAVMYVGQLPYGRNTDRAGLHLVLREGRGTCATKHALLAKLASEQGQNNMQLVIGIYEMNGSNTPGVGPVLEKYELNSIPEAHCYIKVHNQRYDFTRMDVESEPIERFLKEEVVAPDQIGDYKVELHRAFLSEWLNQTGLCERMDIEELWRIREECIRSLSE